MRTPDARSMPLRRAAVGLLLAAGAFLAGLAAETPVAVAAPVSTAPTAPTAAPAEDAGTAAAREVAPLGDAAALLQEFAAPVAIEDPVPTDDELVGFLTSVHGDLISTWRRLLEAWGLSPAPRLALFHSRDTAVLDTACGPVRSDVGPFYCGGDRTIYLDVEFARTVWSYVGDMALVQVVAHEFGHGVQQLLGLSSTAGSPSVELQADCLGGAYAQDADARRLLEPGDVEEARELSRLVGDTAPSDDPHGTADQRVQAWDRGFGGGLTACLSV
jgi:predicted metalloprotease